MKYKFRSWISSTREFTYFEDGNYTLLTATKSHVFNWQAAEQYTGLNDKAGKEIFVGDVVFIAGEGLRRKHKEIVIFEDGKFGTKNAFDSLFNCEIVGNIKEDSEYWGGLNG